MQIRQTFHPRIEEKYLLFRKIYSWPTNFLFLPYKTQNKKKIYVFGGQRTKDSCSDVMHFDVESNTFASTVQTTATTVASSTSTAISSTAPFDYQGNMEKPFGPCYGACDGNKGEMYVLSMKDNLWSYSTTTNEFSLIHKSSQQQHQALNLTSNSYFLCANQMLYVFRSDSIVHTISLHKPSRENVLNYCKYLIRKQKYEEIAHSDPLSALKFLRNNLSEAIDRNDQNQLNDFHKLASLLFCENKATIKARANDNVEEDDGQHVATSCLQGAQGASVAGKIRNQRSILFNKLTSLLPKSKRQPQESLLNFINI